jgi:NAD-dependent dihydropyrimidine dehydrogenase PreA subunit
MIREIVRIDEDKCDGCGLCVPSCHEGAIQVVDGKARLIADRLCDGLGACLGHCPRGAITVERREAESFDEQVVAARAGNGAGPAVAVQSGYPSARPAAVHGPGPAGGCPSARFLQFGGPGKAVAGPGEAPVADGPSPASELSHWPVKLRLLPPSAPVLQNVSLLVAADCVPVAFPAFQSRLLRGHAVVIGCPKFDDMHGHVDKLLEMIRQNDLAEIVVAHMEVPCCTGLLMGVLEARRRSGKPVPVVDVVISTRGEVLRRQEVPLE